MSTPLSSACASPADWARETFATAELGDPRRTARLVRVAAALAACPGGSLPQQLGNWAALKAAYRFLDTAAISMVSILQPHTQHTRQAAQERPVVLLVQDTTTLDFSHHRKTSGLGPIGDGRGRGFQLQTVLAVAPDTGMPLGVLAAEPWIREPKRPAETRTQRRDRPRESQRWGRMVRTVGSPPPDTIWVHVADREADCFDFLAAIAATGADGVVRIAQNRRVVTDDPTLTRLFSVLDATPPADQRRVVLPTRSRPTADLALCWHAVQVRPPAQASRPLATHAPLAAWAIRVWEPDPPDGEEAIHWQILTTVPVTDAASAWERIAWYTRRWVIEEYHQCLKTGCAIEASQVRDAANLMRLLGLLIPLAVRLLQVRSLAHSDPAAPVAQVATPRMIALVATALGRPPATTVAAFLQQIGRLGGWLARKNDGPPGWRTLWRGWLRVQAWLDGADLVRHSQGGC